jgi:transcription-repair coupling factor (superfamily II helicase)
MITVYGVPEGVDALVLVRRLGEHGGPVLHIARDDTRLAGLVESIGFFGPEVEVISFPAWDCLPYDRVSPNGAIMRSGLPPCRSCRRSRARSELF